jgi:hypothetical protein
LTKVQWCGHPDQTLFYIPTLGAPSKKLLEEQNQQKNLASPQAISRLMPVMEDVKYVPALGMK